MRANDLTGRRFDMLTALYPLEERKHKCVMWMCRCDCGTVKAVPSTDLTGGRVKSCGCLKHRIKDITGEKRGHLTALRYTGRRDERGNAIYEWRCDCGNVFSRSVCGTAGNADRLCPECVRRLKAALIDSAREKRKVDPDTGLTPRYLKNLIQGVLTERNTSGVRGVYWHEGHKRWVATGRQDGRLVNLGEYDDLGEAREARQRYVLETYGIPAVRLGIKIE